MHAIRLFKSTEEDYVALVPIYQAARPDDPQFTAEQWPEDDTEWHANALNQRFVAELDDQIDGISGCQEEYWQNQAGTVHIDIDIHPDYRKHHVDQSLFVAVRFLDATV